VALRHSGYFIQSEKVGFVQYLAPPVQCLWHHPQTREKKNVELKVFSKPCNVLRGKQCLVASQTLVVYAPYAQRMNPERRSSLCIKMQSGWLLLMDVCRTDGLRRYVPSEVCSRRTHFTGPSLSIACRLLSPRYRCPPLWSCRCCLCLVASMTGLVLSTSSRIALNALRGLKALFPPQIVTGASCDVFPRSAVAAGRGPCPLVM